MALVITVSADIEPQQVLYAADKDIDLQACNSLSDYGSYTSQSSFKYPGESLSDDEFSQEFSSRSSSRRSSQDLPNLLCAAQIPAPPPPPPLTSNMISFIRVPAPPASPPALPDITSRPYSRHSSLQGSPTLGISPVSLPRGIECVHGHVYGFCPRPYCPYTFGLDPEEDYELYDTDDEYYLDRNRRRVVSPDAECTVCFSEVESDNNTRKCCSQVVCKSCITEIVRTNIEDEGNIQISCPHPECEKGIITHDEIRSLISGSTKEKFDRLRLRESEDGTQKTCPNCCLMTEHKLPGMFRRYKAENFMLTCTKCQFKWCFRCHAPWHTSLTCRQFQKGDKNFKKWTQSKSKKGTANCQKCPLCRVYIQRSTGCDHMTCNRCDTEFCYKCGGQFLDIPGLGNHYSNTSVFGCSANYKRDKPVQRKAVRGGYLAAKLAMLTGYPVLFVAGVAVVVLVGAVALPIYGGYRYYKFKKTTNKLYRRRRK